MKFYFRMISNLVPRTSSNSAHSCTLNACDNNVYEGQKCTTSFIYSTDNCTGQWCSRSTLKDGLPVITT